YRHGGRIEWRSLPSKTRAPLALERKDPVMTVITNPAVLTQDILDRCARRAPEYDRENRFFHEDFEELRASGYLLMAVPVELGGLGLSLAEVCRETARL